MHGSERLDLSQDEVQRSGHLGEIQCADEQGRVLDLPAAAGAHEAAKLLLIGPAPLRRLALEGPERGQLTLSVDNPFHGGEPERADQLVLQIRLAYEEAPQFNVGASEVGSEPGPPQTALEVAFLRGVAQARQPDVEPLGTEQLQGASDVLRTPDGRDGDAFRVEITTTALGERFERTLVADAFDEHDRARRGGNSERWVAFRQLILTPAPPSPCCQVPSRSSRSSMIGHAPSEVFEITVWMIVDAGSCVLQKDTPAS